jgi:hypothetical protein
MTIATRAQLDEIRERCNEDIEYSNGDGNCCGNWCDSGHDDVLLLLETVDTLVTALKDTASFLGCSDSARSILCFDCVASSKCTSAECFQYREVSKLLKGME